MSKLFEELVKSDLITKWAKMLDWYFDEFKFDKTIWNSVLSRRLTNMIKKNVTNNGNVEYDSRCKLSFEKYSNSSDKSKNSILIFSKGTDDCFCKDLIRHIRNGIAHGNTNCTKISKTLFITIRDYSDHKHKEQTAYIHIPLDYILKFYECYKTCIAA